MVLKIEKAHPRFRQIVGMEKEKFERATQEVPNPLCRQMCRDDCRRSRRKDSQIPSAHVWWPALAEDERHSSCGEDDGWTGNAEIHWFEAHGVGKVRWKIKRELDG